MNNLTLILVSETLFWVFFTRKASYLHACILLILVKVGWPIFKSVSLHLFWRIPRAFIRGEFVETVKHHFHGWFGDPYKKYLRTDPLPVHEPIKEPQLNIKKVMAQVDEEYEALVREQKK